MSIEITSPPEDSIPSDQSCRKGDSQTRLLATNLARSVLVVQRNFDPHPISYGAYGYCPVQSLHAMLGYNGEAHLSSGLYLLGNGNRAYSPTLYRFISPDRASIFLPGNMNAYAYTAGDPINRIDPSGNMFKALSKLFGGSKNRGKSVPTQPPPEPNPLTARYNELIKMGKIAREKATNTYEKLSSVTEQITKEEKLASQIQISYKAYGRGAVNHNDPATAKDRLTYLRSEKIRLRDQLEEQNTEALRLFGERIEVERQIAYNP
ncbi:RHS repeat-associated core domain-containing protein [Pseudomonas peradeniyensis]|nr:RHS repeat-associated core domain-containing protein [Pseudomonas peradeniyensis]